MSKLIPWTWTCDTSYRRIATSIVQEERNWVLRLPAPLNAPMKGVITYQLLRGLDRLPEPLTIEDAEMERLFLHEAEQFLGRHAGIDLNGAILVEPTSLRMKGLAGVTIHVPAVFFWIDGAIGLSSARQWDLDANYYVDRVLLLTELRHACDLE